MGVIEKAKAGFCEAVDGRSLLVFMISLLAMILILGIIVMAFHQGSADLENVKFVANALLPVVGTWMGTIIAYYFSKENFQAASDSMQQIVRHLSPQEVLQSLAIKDAMLPIEKITAVKLEATEQAKDVKLKDRLLNALKPPVTRVPVLNADQSILYIIHQSVLFQFVTENAGKAGFDLNQATLGDFLAHDANRDLVSRTAALAAVDGTLADAKAAMDKIKGCQDVFITKTGKREEPVLGWLTDVDLMKHARV